MLHNSEIKTLEVQLARQARVSSVVLMVLSAVALAKVLAQVLGALSTLGH
ncbi:hypothetical protein ACETIH_15275 [Microvirga arabica]|uniref:Uncharacterized protein n=1 Tax=Microvirga arabica TaxID=1128671 RepID=A0ABV6YA32_9HYPH